MNKIHHIVTGFDANYLHKALVFYRSLIKVNCNFKLYVFCFDEVTYEVLSEMKLTGVYLYHFSHFETKELLKIKHSKVKLYEYYWACNPTMVNKVFNDHKVSELALSDCDLMFFESPEAIYKELKNADIIIQPNNFSYESVKDFLPVGYYCVSYQVFKNSKNAKEVINKWDKDCMEWCSATFEEGRFGDQKYLEKWRLNYNNVLEIANPGIGVAPWNIQKFQVTKQDGKILLNNVFPLVYYHFHSFRMNLDNYEYIITGDRENTYSISEEIVNIVYQPYIVEMEIAIKDLKKNPLYLKYTSDNPSGNFHRLT